MPGTEAARRPGSWPTNTASGKTPVQRLLLDLDVPMRKQPLTADAVAVAADRYRADLSLAAVAEQLETQPFDDLTHAHPSRGRAPSSSWSAGEFAPRASSVGHRQNRPDQPPGVKLGPQ